MFIVALLTIAKTGNTFKWPSTGKWIKMLYICAMEYYSAIKNNEIMPFAAMWMHLETVIQSKSDRGEI